MLAEGTWASFASNNSSSYSTNNNRDCQRDRKRLRYFQVASGSDVVVLAVKPDIYPAVLQEIEPHLKEDALVISIAGGISLAAVEQVICLVSAVDHRRCVPLLP